MQHAIATCPGLRVVEAAVDDLALHSTGAVAGVVTASGETIAARSVVLTAGTFLRGKIHIGRESRPAGRMVRESESGEVEPPTVGIAATLDRMGLPLARLKTGTPPRLDGRTIDWRHAGMELQPSEVPPVFFSYANVVRGPARAHRPTRVHRPTHAPRPRTCRARAHAHEHSRRRRENARTRPDTLRGGSLQPQQSDGWRARPRVADAPCARAHVGSCASDRSRLRSSIASSAIRATRRTALCARSGTCFRHTSRERATARGRATAHRCTQR
eukprot:1523248-Prymnesium_polylepis.1